MDAGVLVRFTLVEGGFRSKNADLYLRRIPAGRACVACDFLPPLLRFLRRKAKRDPAVAPLTDAFKGVRVVSADMNWRMRFLQRFRIRFYGRVVDELAARSEEHTSELQSHSDLVCRLLLEKKKRMPTFGMHI